MDIGLKIKEARKAKNLTQEELGNIVGVQKSAIAKYESGRVVNIKRSTLRKLASTLDLRGSDLIDDVEADPVSTAEFHAKVLKDSETIDMIKKYYKLEDEQKKIVKTLVDSLAK